MNRYMLIGVIILLQACASPIYYAKRIQGQVVDEQTGQPLESVIVVAEWVLLHKIPGKYYHDKKLRIVETLTDQNGNYVISGSPMVRLRPLTELANRDPEMSFFKKGYSPLFVSNSYDRDTVIRYSEWGDRVLKLKRFNYSNERYAHSLSILYNYPDYREWQSVPRLLLSVYEEVQRLNLSGVDVPDINKFSVTDKQFLEEFKNEK